MSEAAGDGFVQYLMDCEKLEKFDFTHRGSHKMLRELPSNPWHEYFNITSSTTISVLPFLRGKPWDARALSLVLSLRPRSIRVSNGGQTLESNLGCINVFISQKTNLIVDIEFGVCVGIPPNMEDGSGFDDLAAESAVGVVWDND